MLDTKLEMTFENKILTFFGTQELVQKFRECSCTTTRLAMIWKVPLIQELLKKNAVKVFEKSEGETRRYRELGNKHFQGGRWEKASACFSTAACFAPQNDNRQGKDYSLALANRSAALFHLGKYTDCLEDIDLAILAGYPKDIKYKVLERRVLCYLQLGEHTLADQAFSKLQDALPSSKLDVDKREKLVKELREELQDALENKKVPEQTVSAIGSTEPWLEIPTLVSRHPTLPSLSSAVNIVFDVTRGRHAVAKRDIDVGEVVCVEEALTSCLYYTMREDHCDFCFKYIPVRQLNCDTCSALRFCSKQCKQSATDTYHVHECGWEDVFESTLGKMLQEGKKNADSSKKFHRLALKTVTQKSLKWLLSNRETVGTFSNNVKQFCDGYEGLAKFVSHSHRMPLPRTFTFLISAIFHLRNLQLSGYFGQRKLKVSESLSPDELYIGELLYSYLEKMQFNTHGILEGVEDPHTPDYPGLVLKASPYENNMRCAGNGIYPSLAMLNHSCYNNIYKYNIGTTIIAVASQRIQAGEEITENYCPVAQVMPRPERRAWLSESYWFDCCCRACLANHPTIVQMHSTPTHFRCQKDGCSGIVTEPKCKLCSTMLDREVVKSEVAALWTGMQDLRKDLHTRSEFGKLKTLAQQVKQKYKRIVCLIDLPCSVVYEAEIIYWRSIRLLHGNRFY